MLQKIIRAAAWSFLAFVVYATLSPIELRPELVGASLYKALFTVIERVGAFAVLGLLFYLAYPSRLTFVWILVLGSAVMLELLQLIVPGRDARVLDIAEKLFGGAVGILSGNILWENIWIRASK